MLPERAAKVAEASGLNPFYFRAGLLRGALDGPAKYSRLNPFYFRAGLLHNAAVASKMAWS